MQGIGQNVVTKNNVAYKVLSCPIVVQCPCFYLVIFIKKFHWLLTFEGHASLKLKLNIDM